MQSLKQIEIDEKYGGLPTTSSDKKSKEPKAQIGFVYEDSSGSAVASGGASRLVKKTSPKVSDNEDAEDDNDEDLDLALNINKLTSEHKVIINKCATNYGMQYGDYVRMLILDNEEKEAIARNKLVEAEKAQYSGRKSRRERRIAKEKRLRGRGSLSPLSYIVRDEPSKNDAAAKEDGEGEYYGESLSASACRRRHSSSRSGCVFDI